MRKASVVLTLVFTAGIAAYLVWAYPRLPAVVPMKWDLHNVPVAFGSREAFVGIPAAISLLFAVMFLAAAWWQPKAAWCAPLALGTMLFFVHVTVQAVLQAFLPIPVNVAVFGMLGLLVPTLAVGWIVFRRRPRKPA